MAIEDVRRTIVGIRIVVNNDEEVVGAIIGERGVKLEVVPSLSAVERAGVDLLEVAAVGHKTAAQRSGRHIGHVDGHISLAAHGCAIGILEVNAGEGAGAVKFASKYQLLGVTIMIVVTDRQIIGRSGTVTNLDGVGSGGIKLCAREVSSGELDAVHQTKAIGTAVSLHIDLVCGGRGKATEDSAVGGHIEGGGVAGGTNAVVGHHIVGRSLIALLPIPGKQCTTHSGVDLDICHTRAKRHLLEGDVVDGGVPAAGGAQGADGHILAIASVAAQGHGVFSIGRTFHRDGLHRDEGGGIARVGHHTHLEHGMVGRAGGAGPEAQLKGVDGVGDGIHSRHGHNLVVAISAGSGASIPIGTLATTRGVVVARSGADIRIAEVSGTVVETEHAVDKRGARRVTRLGSLESLHIRKRAQGSAFRSGTLSGGEGGITAAHASHLEFIGGAGNKVVDEDGGGTGSQGDGVEAAHAVGNQILGGIVATLPLEAGASSGGADGEVGGTCAARNLGAHVKLDIHPVVGAGEREIRCRSGATIAVERTIDRRCGGIVVGSVASRKAGTIEVDYQIAIACIVEHTVEVDVDPLSGNAADTVVKHQHHIAEAHSVSGTGKFAERCLADIYFQGGDARGGTRMEAEAANVGAAGFQANLGQFLSGVDIGRVT